MSAGALRRSALGEVRHSPRFLALMGVMLVAAVGYGARDVSRLRYTTELTGDALGIGAAAVAFAGGLAVGGVASGPLSDRIDPRWILVVGPPLQGLAPGPAFRRSPRRRRPWCPRMPAVRPRSSASCDWGWERRWGSSSRASVPTRWPLSSASAFCSAQPPVLRRVVVADLVLCVAIPTQFANVVLASDWDESLVTPVLASGVLGVLVG